ncbi:hypothetical protein ES711_09730 [Gelidibacter salicanalis]|uniref:Uncharacterized protein n=1 Tax=Gelidibacter salicanalis TaxID=291193 RepID=A0A5C7AH11_9FLAO|nr:hypothetical protein [Gelidibacter salicanalis]TXE07711.1 hypothetical protein ES711_09730 [Gelidibacter salicanalis]
MRAILNDIVPRLQPFEYALHYDTQFINQKWVLINGIDEAKAVYLFKPNNVLLISEDNQVTKTRWSFINSNFISITTADGMILIKAYYKDKDMLVLNQKESEDYAFFINSSAYETTIDTKEDVQQYFKDKYLKKATQLITEHQFYYIQRFKEYGPYTLKELLKKVKNKAVNAYCLVRDVNESDYTHKLRIIDLMHELN